MVNADKNSKEYAITTLNDTVNVFVSRPYNEFTDSLLLLQKILRKVEDNSFDLGFQDIGTVIDCFAFGQKITRFLRMFGRLNIEKHIIDILKILTDVKFDVKFCKDSDGISLLTLACQRNRNDLARFLIENGANVSCDVATLLIESHKYTETCPEDMYRYMLSSPLPCCVCQHNHEIFELILENGVNIAYEIKIESPILKFAAGLSDSRMLLSLTLLYKKFNCPDQIIFDAALCALIQDNIENFSILFGALENKNYSKNGFTLMGCAIVQKKVAAVKECLNIANNIDEYCYEKDTPQDLAIKIGSKELIDLITTFAEKRKTVNDHLQNINNSKYNLNFVAKLFGVDKAKRNFSAYIDFDTQFATKISIEDELIDLYMCDRLTFARNFYEKNNIIEFSFEAIDNNKKFGYISKQDSKPVINMYKQTVIANKSLQESEFLAVVIYASLHEIKENSEFNEELYLNIDVEIIKASDAIQLLHEQNES